MKFAIESQNTNNFYIDLLDEYGDLFEKHNIKVEHSELRYGMGCFQCLTDIYYIELDTLQELVKLMTKLEVDVEIKRVFYPGLDEPVLTIVLC